MGVSTIYGCKYGTWSYSSIDAFVAAPLIPSVTATKASKRALSGIDPFWPSRSRPLGSESKGEGNRKGESG